KPTSLLQHEMLADVRVGMVRPCSRPCQRAKLARGHRKTKEHAMSEKLNSKLAVIGIDIGKNSFHILMCPIELGMLSNSICTWPAIRSGYADAAARYGT